MLPPLPPSLIARVRKLSAREEGFEGVRGRKGEKKSESHGGASAGRPVRPRVDAALRRRTATRRETEKPLWNAGRLLNAMRELSRPDILSPMPGTGNRKVEFTLVPDLIGRFALCRAPTRFPQCHGRRGGRGKKEKRKELQDSENAGEDFIWLASRKRGEEERRWEGKRVFDLYLFYIGREIIERGREKSLEIEAKCYFFFFFFAPPRLHAVIAVDLKICQKKNGRSLDREDGLSLASGLLFVICVYFYRSLICRMQLTVKQCRVAKRTTTQETRSLASVYLPRISLSLRYNYWWTDLIN